MDANDLSPALDLQDYRLLLQDDFHSFLHRSFSELNPRTAFYDNWHIAVLAAKKCVCVATDFVGCIRLHLGQLLPPAMFVDGDEDEVSAGYVQMRACLRILDPDFDADLHRGVEGAVHPRLQDQQIANVDGCDEVDVVHRGSDDVGAGVAIGGHRSHEVDEMHEPAAEQIAEGVGVVGQDQLGHLRLGL